MSGLQNVSSCRARRNPAARSAFTLIELLVTVVIIGLLAAILLPALSSARERARRVLCASNQRQLSTAMVLYAGDNNEALPCYFGGTVFTNGSGGGVHLKVHLNGRWSAPANLGPISNTKLLLCPTDKSPAQFSLLDANNNPITVGTSFAYNYELYMTGTRLSRCDAASLVLLMDGDDLNNAQNGVWYSNVNPSKQYKDIDRFNNTIATRRHFNRFDIAYLDTHVELGTTVLAGSLLPGFQ